MRRIDVMNISMNQIQMFLAVARLGNITNASQYLNVSQSTLSKNIQKLEQELDLILFIREKNRLRLSPAGKVLQRELSNVSVLVENAVIKAHNQQAVQKNPLIIALPMSVTEQEYLFPALNKMCSEYPDFQYFIEYYTFHELPFAVLSDEVDVAFTPLFQDNLVDRMGLNHKVIKYMPLTVTMTSENPLNQKSVIMPADLKFQNFFVLSETLMPEYMEYVINPVCEEGKFNPRIAFYASSTEAMIASIQNDDEIYITDDGCVRPTNPNLCTYPIQGTTSGVIAVWNHSKHKYLQRLLETIE
ncbi:MAG: LysR family transcriptional regulator [Lachnospiraceae bacterium]|nr:LysR family transcriptional regulator [Lachnospiraceae bacterium]